MAFNERLRALRNEKKLSMTKFAEEIGVTRQIIALYEKGDSIPSIVVLADIADYFGVSADYLLGRDEYAVLSCEKNNCIQLPKGLTEDDCETVKEIVVAMYKRRQNQNK